MVPGSECTCRAERQSSHAYLCAPADGFPPQLAGHQNVLSADTQGCVRHPVQIAEREVIRRALIIFALTLVMSAFVFPISFTFLPVGINSKILVGVFGILALVYDSIRKHQMILSEPTIFAGLFAAIFSVWCLYAITNSNTYDTIYADYIVSFATWMISAYGVCAALRIYHEKVDLEIITRYLLLAGVFQCITAVLIDNNAAFANFVDRFMDQGQDFYKRGHRLYGIGAALDPAGIRFSVILVMAGHQFSTCPNIRNSNLYQVTVLVAFSIITLIGVVISRTTLLGASLSLVYIIIALFRMRKGGFVTTRMVQIFFWFFIVMAGIIGAVIYFYQSNDVFHGYLRFGFEAFFNWVETGEFSTNSMDVLETMWIWPDDLHTWIFGRGTFGVFDNGTDIGYCNFTLYCGLVGMVLFSIYFIYCHLVQRRKYREFGFISIILIILTFAIWVKVTTDIFFIDALLFCATGDKESETTQSLETQVNDNAVLQQ